MNQGAGGTRAFARADAAAARRAECALWLITGVAIAAVLAAAVSEKPMTVVLGAFVAGLIVVSYQRTLLAWQTLLGLILLIILFVPMRRYAVGGGLPIELEPYRIVIAIVLACWLSAVCVDPAVSWRRTGLELPILVLLGAILLSLTLNVGRVNDVSGLVLKQVTFFCSYFLVVYLIASVIRSRRQLESTIRLLVVGGAIVAVASLIEWQTGTNLFNWYGHVVPFLSFVDLGEHLQRGGGVRALGSAQHPIALAAALVMLIPMAAYLHRRDGHFGWLACGGLMTLGALSTGSRTGALMLIALLVSVLVMRPRDTIRLVPYLVPLGIVIQIIMPGTLGTFRAILSPSYVIKEQSIESGTGSGRIADLGPALEEWSHKPLFGAGFGTRIPATDADQNGVLNGVQILDNQWLGMLLDIGAVGALAFLWLLCRAIRRLARRARSDPGPDGWLTAMIGASLVSFSVGMLSFDAFAFIQVMFIAFIMLAMTGIVTRRSTT